MSLTCAKNTRTGQIGFVKRPVSRATQTDDPNEKFYEVDLPERSPGIFSEKVLTSFTRAHSVKAIEAAKQLNALELEQLYLDEKIPDNWLVDPSGWKFLCEKFAGRTDTKDVRHRLATRNGLYCCPADRPRAT